MSNRSLIEINHDFSGTVRRDQNGFLNTLLAYLGSASPENAAALAHFGIKVFGMRHHSDPYAIDWGGHKHEET